MEFGSLFRGPKLDRRLKYTLNRLRRGAETNRDFSGVALLEAHPFLSDPDLMAQGAARPRLDRLPPPRPRRLPSCPARFIKAVAPRVLEPPHTLPSGSRAGPRLRSEAQGAGRGLGYRRRTGAACQSEPPPGGARVMGCAPCCVIRAPVPPGVLVCLGGPNSDPPSETGVQGCAPPPPPRNSRVQTPKVRPPLLHVFLRRRQGGAPRARPVRPSGGHFQRTRDARVMHFFFFFAKVVY